MGSPKKQRKKFSKPSHPWQKERILAEQEISKSYGLRRKYEIWKMNTILKNFTRQAKNLIASKKQQSETEKNQLITKLSTLGIIGSDSKIEDVLSLTLKDVMDRRLQTIVFKKNLARNLKQARQFIVHEHISVGDKTIATPSYMVLLSEENNIQFAQGSTFADPNHPERVIVEKKQKIKETKKEEPEKKTKSEEKKEKTAEEKKTPEKKETKSKEEKPKETKKEQKETK